MPSCRSVNHKLPHWGSDQRLSRQKAAANGTPGGLGFDPEWPHFACHEYLILTNKQASSIRVPSKLRSWKMRKPRRSRPRTAVSYATSRPLSLTLIRMNVALGSAAMQCTSSPKVAFIPFSSTLSVVASISTFCGNGSVVLAAQKPDAPKRYSSLFKKRLSNRQQTDSQ